MKDHMQKFATLFTFTAVLVYTPLLIAEVYKTVDEHGNVVYTDQRPNADAKPVDLPGLSIISPQIPPTRAKTASKAAERPDQAGATDDTQLSFGQLKRGYRDFAIVSPTQDQAFAGMGDEIFYAAWNTEFQLRAGMTVTVYFDGQAQEPTTAASIALGRLDRGAHQVYAVLNDARNRRIASTDPVSFHVRRNSINFQNRRRR